MIEGDNFADIDFRRGMSRQAATTVALLTSAAGGREDVMACEWAMMVSSAPVCFIVSVGPRKVTHELITASGEFGLSFCSPDQARLSHIAGSYSLRDTDKWSLADYPTYPATKIGAPMIDGATVNVECRLRDTNDLGSHTVFIGEAVWTRYDPERSPMIYHSGRYWRIGEQIPKT